MTVLPWSGKMPDNVFKSFASGAGCSASMRLRAIQYNVERLVWGSE